MREIIDRLYNERILNQEEFGRLLETTDESDMQYLFKRAREVSKKHFGNKIYIRGLIEFTNYCRNDCYYCGIRKSNRNADRYRLSKDDILKCCENGYELGFRTFVLQGGDDPWYSDEKLIDIISDIRVKYADCAITLSIGEKTFAQYEKFFRAGADRYLLRHETADSEHYKKLHPSDMSGENRKDCLFKLKDIGYQAGAGFMVGSPYQSTENIVEDLLFLKKLKPAMVGIGPFIPAVGTPFDQFKRGDLNLTLKLLSIIRLMFPNVLLPSTTALGTIHPYGRELGIMAGANVVMPNLSPTSVRKKYMLYDNKICTGDEAAECRSCLEGRMKKIGYEITVDRGDFHSEENEAKEG